MIKHIMLKVYAIIVITNMAELKSHGIALMKNSTLEECVKTVTSICTIKRSVSKATHQIKNLKTSTMIEKM